MNLKPISFLKKFSVISLFCITGMMPTSGNLTLIKIISVKDPNIQYIGRFDFSEEEVVRFDWSGVQIKTIFSGSFCAIKLKDGHNDYNIFIDGKLTGVLRTSQDTVYTLAENLEGKRHSLLITKRTEARNGIAIFKGFILSEGNKLYPPVGLNKRKIEFVGDSFVAGLGSEGKSPDCLFSRESENNYIAYGPVLARRLNADYSIVAVSGIGIGRNYGDTTLISYQALPYYYERTCFNENKNWDFQKWQPDLVVIRLGNNDFWKKPFPSQSLYQKEYINFLKRIRKLYPHTCILVLCEPVRKDPHCDYTKLMVAELEKELHDKRIWFEELDVVLDKVKDYGCQEHPNESGHKKIADALEPIIRKAMNW